MIDDSLPTSTSLVMSAHMNHSDLGRSGHSLHPGCNADSLFATLCTLSKHLYIMFMVHFDVRLWLFIVQVLAHLLDMVFYSDEKERVIPLLVNIMHYVVPYLRNHRWDTPFGFYYCLLCSSVMHNF